MAVDAMTRPRVRRTPGAPRGPSHRLPEKQSVHDAPAEGKCKFRTVP